MTITLNSITTITAANVRDFFPIPQPGRAQPCPRSSVFGCRRSAGGGQESLEGVGDAMGGLEQDARARLLPGRERDDEQIQTKKRVRLQKFGRGGEERKQNKRRPVGQKAGQRTGRRAETNKKEGKTSKVWERRRGKKTK